MVNEQTCLTKPKSNRRWLYLALSFALPFVIQAVVFALHKVRPFGDKQILIIDYWHQYHPFLSDFWHKLREGESLLWSWTSGTGTNYWALIAYYLASPLNLLIALFPLAWLQEVMLVIVLARIGCAGLFFALYLRRAFERLDLSTVAFSVFYALCAYVLGYYWNIMWLDTFALLPLTLLGVQALVREGRWRLYVVSLALSVWCNYYIGLFTCFFVAIMFLVYCFVGKVGWRAFMRKLAMIVGCSILALGLTAVLTAPAFFALQKSYSAIIKFPAKLKFFVSFGDILGNLIAFSPPTKLKGLPNLYCGMISVLLAIMFATSRKVARREKLTYLGVVLFLLVSCNLNVLNYIWHGFHVPNSIPYRFAFLISFMLLVMAYRVYPLLEEMNRLDLHAMGIGAVLLLHVALAGPQENSYVYGNFALCAAYLLLLIVYKRYKHRWRHINRRTLGYALMAVMLAECSITTYIAYDVRPGTSRTGYPNQYGRAQELLGMREGENADFYRTEFTARSTGNTPAIYGFDGVTFFCSTVNVNTVNFTQALGLSSRGSSNRIYYFETSPVANAFLNIRYLLCLNGNSADGGAYWEEVGKVSSSLLLENNHYLPLGFMVNEEVADYKGNANNPFASQQNLFQRATGLAGDLFTLLAPTDSEHANYTLTDRAPGEYRYESEGAESGTLTWRYEAPMDGPLYAYIKIDNINKMKVTVDGKTLRTIEYDGRPFVACIGNFAKGELVSLEVNCTAKKGNAVLYVGSLDADLFDQGYALLKDEPLRLTAFEGTHVAGDVTALKGGLLYTSIPYEKGWTATVDGVESEILAVGGSMAALRISEGTHRVEFHYQPEGLIMGAGVSLVSLAAFVALLVLERHRNRKKARGLRGKER